MVCKHSEFLHPNDLRLSRMGDFSIIGGGANCLESGFDSTNVQGTAITAANSAHTKGSYVELLSAANNTYSSDFIEVVVTNDSQLNDGAFLVDIAIGSAGNEEDIIPNLWCHASSTLGGLAVYKFPFPITMPPGVKIAARCQSSIADAVTHVHIIRHRKSLSQTPGLGRVTAIGVNTNDTSGVIVLRTTAGTWGSWTEITSATAKPIKGFVVVGVKITDSWSQGSQLGFEVAVGSADNEEAIYTGGTIQMNGPEGNAGPVTLFIPVQIAVGERIAIRAVGNLTNTDLDLDYVIYGVD